MLRLTTAITGLLRFVLILVGATGVVACGTVYQAPDDPFYMSIQTVESTCINGVCRTHVTSIAVDAFMVQTTPQSINLSGRSQVTINTGSDGFGYAENVVLNAYWHFRPAAGPCRGQYTIPLYIEQGVFAEVGCVGIFSGSGFEDLSVLTDGTSVFTGGTDKLLPGEELFANDSRTSADGRFTLLQQADGNLVLYNNQNGAALWASNTCCWSYPTKTQMQLDGNLVVTSWAPMWDSGTAGNSGAVLIVQSNGHIAIYDPDTEVGLWIQ